jgi:transcriptional regulator with XRE-family HTH domain
MDIDYEAIGKRIQFWRKRRSLTQEQLVLFIEREPAYLSRIEHGNQKPRLDALLRVCQALNIDINNLLTDSPKMQSADHLREMEFLMDGCSDYELSVILQSATA